MRFKNESRKKIMSDEFFRNDLFNVFRREVDKVRAM